ncbi:hypothetical protein NIES4071_103250 (plasmid) [Calothrix sp. NIES-4071]|nr:hypothetical protein NIES4071_103250 [Calothrix sp. NIES-4071]BAZ64706.1 hypothetical protein NIES4105_104390 [Calothrix sp. NIES-4105]
MHHINQVVLELGVQRDEIISCCTLLNLKVDGDKLSPETVRVLNNVKAVADKGSISFMEAAQHVANMKNGEHGAQQNGNRFSKREYIKQRFGVDPEAAAPGSFIWMLYQDVIKQSEQLGEVRFQTVIEASSHVLRDRLMNGNPENANNEGFEEANNRVSENITSFLGNVNWGELPQLMGGSSTQPTKQLQAAPASTSKTPTSGKKSSDK